VALTGSPIKVCLVDEIRLGSGFEISCGRVRDGGGERPPRANRSPLRTGILALARSVENNFSGYGSF
jgi:hypothetical protein